MFRDRRLPGRAAATGVLLLGGSLHACACLPHGTSLRVTLVDSAGSPIDDALVSCRESGSSAERATQVDRGVYDCGTGQGRFFLDISWRGNSLVSRAVDVFDHSSSCGSQTAPVDLSFTLTPTATDGGAALDAGAD